VPTGRTMGERLKRTESQGMNSGLELLRISKLVTFGYEKKTHIQGENGGKIKGGNLKSGKKEERAKRPGERRGRVADPPLQSLG